MERRKFTREFKLEAVRLIKDRGVSYVQASQDLGVHTSQLYTLLGCSPTPTGLVRSGRGGGGNVRLGRADPNRKSRPHETL
jgi:transposase